MSKPLDIVIIGGGSAGINCAIKARKLDEKVNIILFDEADTIGNSPCKIPNFIADELGESDIVGSGAKLLKNFFNIEVKTKSSLQKIDKKAKLVFVKDTDTNLISNYHYDKLVIATGSKAKVLPNSQKLENVFYLYNAQEAIRFKNSLTKNSKKILLIGGGVMNLEFASSLMNCEVTLVARSNNILHGFNTEMQQHIKKVLAENNVKVILNKEVTRITNSDAMLDDGTILEFDKCLVAIGLSFDKNLFISSGLVTNNVGQIIVNKFYQTNDKSIYACGDAISYPDASGGMSSFSGSGLTAGLAGRNVACNIVTNKKQTTLINYHCFVTSIFNCEVASIGTYCNNPPLASFTFWQQPVIISKDLLSVFVQFDKRNYKITNVQAVGKNAGIVINNLAVLMQIKNDITLLENMQFAYHPEINNVKTVLHNISFIARGIIDNKTKHISALNSLKFQEEQVIDVRTPEEFLSGSLPNAINIPVFELRNRLSEISLSKKNIVVCEMGKRAYYASQILLQNNISATILSGGMKSYRLIKDIKGE